MHDDSARPVWIRGPQLRKRWANMPNSTFYERLSKGLFPAPRYPFGPGTPPHWSLDEIEAHERRVLGAEAIVPTPVQAPPPKRKPGRPRKGQPSEVTR